MNDEDEYTFVTEVNKPEFVEWLQNFCWYNWTIAIQNPNISEEERLKKIKEQMDEVIHPSYYLQDVIDYTWLWDLVESKSESKNKHNWKIHQLELADIINTVGTRVTNDSAADLVKENKAELYWDSEANDFIIRQK